MIIGLASPRVAVSIEDGLARIDELCGMAAAQGAAIVCFPEAYLPGLRGVDIDVLSFELEDQEHVLAATGRMAAAHRLAVILSAERLVEAGRQIAAYVFDSAGRLLGFQTKNQLDPSEDAHYVPGDSRRIFEVGGVKFGIAICHEGWRYPETVRWAARRGAKIVFHPQHTGSDRQGTPLARWGDPEAPYYEKAMLMRSIENGVYFASVNYALRFQEAATSLIHPDGHLLTHLPYGQDGVLVQAIDPDAATGRLAARFAPERLREADTK